MTKRPTRRGDRTIAQMSAWQKFCEAMGTRCTFVADDGIRCDNGAAGGERCAEHPTEAQP